MTLAAKLKIMAILPLTLLLLIFILYFVTSSRLAVNSEKGLVADDLVKATSDFVLLTFEHSMNKYDERPRTQLRQKYINIGQLLEKIGSSFTSDAEEELLDILHRSYKTIGKNLTEHGSLLDSPETPIKDKREEYHDRIDRRLLIQSQSIIPQADMFRKINHEKALRLSKVQTMLILGFFVCLSLCLPIMSLLIMRGIALPISRLQEGMKNISEGGTETVVPVTSHDELGKLSQSFNNMASSLTKVQAELKNAYVSIELKVEERTIQLSDANKKLTAEITERKHAEEELRESEGRYRKLFELSNDAIFLVDIRTGQYLDANHAAEKLTGRSVDELKLLTTKDVTPKESADRLAILRSSNETVDFSEIEYLRPDGTTRTALLGSVPLSENIYYGVAYDITERKRAEEEKRGLEERLNRAEKMESLGILAGGVAHDLNNVLGIVVGYAEMLLLKANESSAIRPSLVEIMKGGQKAAAIVDDLLTLARRGVSGSNILNLNSIISDFQKSPEFMNLSFHHPSVKIKTDLVPNLPNISGSSVHLNKSIFNLVSNASEAMPKGGIITIKTANHYLEKPIHGYDEILEGDYVVLSVSDTGEGIHEADIKRIFEPFYTKKVMGRSGTGLGLAVVWGTVKDHNGYINVESEEGKGSTFSLYFPVTREELSAEHPAVSISEYMGKGESIFIVDDVKEQRDLAAVMLKELNYSVSSVKSGEEAVAYLKGHKADLMILDMIMDPGMDGLDTYRSVLEIRPKQKAIIVSGFSESDRVKAAKALGAGTYVRKPYVIEKLGLAVRKELERAV